MISFLNALRAGLPNFQRKKEKVIIPPPPINPLDSEAHSHVRLANFLKGKTITVPNVALMYEGWSLDVVNPCYEQLQPVADEFIGRYVFGLALN